MCIRDIVDLVTTAQDAALLPVLFITLEPFSRVNFCEYSRVLSQADTCLNHRHQCTNITLLTTLTETKIYSGSFNNKWNQKCQIPSSEMEKTKSVPPTQHIGTSASLLPAAARRGCWRTCAGTWGQSCSSWKTQHSENTRSREACLNQR